MSSGHTDITVLLDRSGSMQSIKTAMESGFAEFVNGHRAIPTTRLTLIQFDSNNDQQVVYADRRIGDVPPLFLEPNAMTPLWDALCKSIDSTGVRLAAMPERLRPANVLFIVITDGLENASRQYDAHDVRSRIEHQRSRYNWQFLFLGANQDAILTAQDLGIPKAQAITYTASIGDTVKKWRGLTNNTINYAQTGIATSLNWSDQQRTDGTADNS